MGRGTRNCRVDTDQPALSRPLIDVGFGLVETFKEVAGSQAGVENGGGSRSTWLINIYWFAISLNGMYKHGS